MEQKAIHMGMLVLSLALLLRLAGNWDNSAWEVGNTLLFLSTGRMATERPAEAPTEPAPSEPQPEAEAAADMAVPVFGQQQENLVQVSAQWEVDTAALLQEPLRWQLKKDTPTVLIIHTHATESYEKESAYQETSPYRTLNTSYNMISIGDRVAELLEAGGISVIHDRSFHDYPSYNSAYNNAREAIQGYLAENPDLCLVLDLHRDAREDGSGNQKGETVEIGGKSLAKLMLVMGSDKGSLPYPNWQTNLALAVKLQAQLEADYPGLCRPVKLAASRYNQDLSTGALLVEVGAAGNTHQEAMGAAELLAQGILALANGANY